MAELSESFELDKATPLASLRAGMGISKAEFARLRGVQPPAHHASEACGCALKVKTLLDAARAAGWEVTLTARKKGAEEG